MSNEHIELLHSFCDKMMKSQARRCQKSDAKSK